MHKVLQVDNLRKHFGSLTVLDGVSFSMDEGERIAILGPSGCGKSTLLQLVAGTLRADAGDIRMDGVTVEGPGVALPPERRPVNMVFQDYALWPHMKVRANIVYGMRHRKVPASERAARLDRLTKLLRLEGLMDRLPAQLSGGQQQRVGIARALATEPRVLLLDEPLSNLDVKLRAEMRHELAALLSSLSITTLHVTHDAMEAFALADRILVVHAGLVEQLATPRELFERPSTPWVAELMGYDNRLNARLLTKDGDYAQVCIGESRLVGLYTALPLGPEPDVSGPEPRRAEVIVMTHQDTMRVSAHSDEERQDHSQSAAGRNSLPARVTGVTYEGTRWRISLQTPDWQEVFAPHHCPLALGTDVRLTFAPASTVIFGWEE